MTDKNKLKSIKNNISKVDYVMRDINSLMGY